MEFITRHPKHVSVIAFAQQLGHVLRGHPPPPFDSWDQYREARGVAGLPVFGQLPIGKLGDAFNVNPALREQKRART